jgi:drug/metabolite transporter (DMT)-like permease
MVGLAHSTIVVCRAGDGVEDAFVINGLLVAAMCLVWGATWLAIKLGLSDSPPLYGAALRFVVAVLVLAGFVWRRRDAWPRDRGTWGWLVVSGILMYFGSYAVVYVVEQYIDSALAAILFSSFPFFVAVGAHLHLPGERLSALKVVGLVIGFLGIVTVFGGSVAAPRTGAWWAPLLMLVSPSSSAVASIIVKKHLTRHDPYVVNFIQMAVGAGLLLPVAMVFENFRDFRWTTNAIGALLFLAFFGSAFAFVAYYHVMKTVAASRLALIAFVTPIIAAALGWLVLHEQLTWATLVGAVLTLTGIWIVNVWAERGKARPSLPVVPKSAAESPSARAT